MGRNYALAGGEKPEVATAIFEHYLPRSQGDALPESGPGILVSLADRFDSLAGLFQIGLAPTGSADPYGLRRSALGLVAILVEREIDVSLREGLRTAAELLGRAIDEKRLERRPSSSSSSARRSSSGTTASATTSSPPSSPRRATDRTGPPEPRAISPR